MVPVRQRLLVPLDGSPLAEVALAEALVFAKVLQCEVILLHVIPPIDDIVDDVEDSSLRQQVETRKTRALEYLNDICGRAEWRSLPTQVVVEMGRPAETILDFAQHQQIDRIVMSTHGRTGLGRWVYGSVADKVLRAADRTIVLTSAGRPPEIV